MHMERKFTNTMDTPTFAQRIAGNYLRSMVPLPDGCRVAESHLAQFPAGAVQAGLTALHRLFEDIYWGALQLPGSFGLPASPDVPPRAGSRYNAAVKAVEAIPRLLYALGICGEPVEAASSLSLRFGAACFTRYCGAAKIKQVEAILAGLNRHGLEIWPGYREWSAIEGSFFSLRFPAAPETAWGLTVFARACCLLAKDELRPPTEFYRVDLRVLAPCPGNPKPIPVGMDDALRALDDEQAQMLSDFDRLVVGLGFRPEVKCSGLARGEWRGSYRNSRLGRTLFGFVVEEGQLSLRIMIDQTRPILPTIQKCPLEFRELFYASCTCSNCNQCADGPLCMVLDGAPRRLCHYAYFEIPSFKPEHVSAMRMLLEVQAHLLKNRD